MNCLRVTTTTIEKLFPFCFVLNDGGEILHMGPSLKKMVQHISVSHSIYDHFTFIKPIHKEGSMNVVDHLDNVVILQEKSTGAKLMGQFIQPNSKPIFVFVGSLSVTDPAELTRLGLDFSDFPVQDQIFDFLMMTQTQKRTLKEADIINQKLAQAHLVAVKASELKSQFLANMSHELRTPMNGILGMASVLKEVTDLSSEQNEYVDNIIQSATTMLALINDILDLSKIESGFIQIQPEMVSVTDVVNEINNVLIVSAMSKNNELKFEIDEELLSEKICTDPLKFRQILMNFIGNANKFTENGVIKTRFTYEKDNKHIWVSVTDTGIGMDAATLSKLFQPFVQGDSSMSKKYGGTGLGLSISKKLIQAMGGKVVVESEVGVGTSFSFYIHENSIESKSLRRSA